MQGMQSIHASQRQRRLRCCVSGKKRRIAEQSRCLSLRISPLFAGDHSFGYAPSQSFPHDVPISSLYDNHTNVVQAYFSPPTPRGFVNWCTPAYSWKVLSSSVGKTASANVALVSDIAARCPHHGLMMKIRCFEGVGVGGELSVARCRGIAHRCECSCCKDYCTVANGTARL